MSGARCIMALLLLLYLGLSSACMILPTRNDVLLAQPGPDLPLDLIEPYPDPDPEQDSESIPMNCDENGNFIGICNFKELVRCGSDGVDYVSGCEVANAQCKNPGLFIIGSGHCWMMNYDEFDFIPMNCDENGNFIGICNFDMLPRCGSDGVTYMGECEFVNAQCKKSGLFIIASGPCHDYVRMNCDENGNFIGICNFDMLPRCGSYGATYTGGCEFVNALCNDLSLEIIGSGYCFYVGGRARMTAYAGELAQLIPDEHNDCKYVVDGEMKHGKYNEKCDKCENCVEPCHDGRFNDRTCKCNKTPFCK